MDALLDDLILEWETTTTSTTQESTSTSTTTTAETTTTTSIYQHFLSSGSMIRIAMFNCIHWRQSDAGVLGGSDGPSYNTHLPDQIDVLKSYNSDLIITAGDNFYTKTDWNSGNATGYVEEFKTEMDGSGLPWYYCYGNHDLDMGYELIDPALDANGINRSFPKKIQIGAWDFIIIDADWSDYGEVGSPHYITQNTLDWLENNLDAQRPTVVVMHPYMIKETASPPTLSGALQNKTELLDTIKNNGNVKVLISGHDHDGPKYGQDNDGLWYITLRRSDGYWPYTPNNYGVNFVDITPTTFRFWSIGTYDDTLTPDVLMLDFSTLDDLVLEWKTTSSTSTTTQESTSTSTTTTAETTSTTTLETFLLDDLILEWETTSTTTGPSTSSTSTTTQPTTSTTTQDETTSTTTAETTSTTTVIWTLVPKITTTWILKDNLFT